MSLLSTSDVIKWLNPWPIELPRGLWRLQIKSLAVAGRYYIFHGKENDQPLTAQEYTTLVRRHILNPKKNAAPAGYEPHYIWMLCNDFAPAMRSLTIIVDQFRGRKRILDGNHRFLAVLLSKRLNQQMHINHVGVLEQC